VQPPRRTIDVDDDRVVHHPVHGRRGDHRIPQIVTELGEVIVEDPKKIRLGMPPFTLNFVMQ